MGSNDGPSISAPSLEAADTVVDLWVDLARGQRAYGSYLCADENRGAIRETMVQRIANDDLLVARRDGAIVGFVSFTIERGRYTQTATSGVIENLYVKPTARRDGIGSALLGAAEQRLTDEGATVVNIEAMAANDAARQFYAHHGYAPHRIELEKQTETDTA